jgi:hypothetical protein
MSLPAVDVNSSQESRWVQPDELDFTPLMMGTFEFAVQSPLANLT